MDRRFYRDTVKRMEDAGVESEYLQGWVGGYIGNPMREEQRLTEAYQAGYADGEQGKADGFGAWRANAEAQAPGSDGAAAISGGR
ncbi:MAG: hypothetical protein ISN28_13170 [Ectothiorhodospiraceae bacterium AqS1]|nr:hypothetical protein [Ectothiorhodospiraceae bacterium AqS1]